MRAVRILALGLVLCAPLAGRAIDGPHDPGANCVACHIGHNAPGGSLTSVSGNYNLCESCHQGKAGFGFPSWGPVDQAVPGTSGTSHSWSALASNLGATPPDPASADTAVEAEMAKRLDQGKLQCSTCHDEHDNKDPVTLTPYSAAARGTQHVDDPLFVGTGTGTMTLVRPVGVDALGRNYRVQIVSQGSGTTALFKISNDKGRSWLGCTSGPTVYTYAAVAAPPSTTSACQAGTGIQLNDAANVKVSFAGASNTLRAGDRWDFYIGYPLLRANNANARMCVTCHRDRNQSLSNVEGSGPIVGTQAAIVLGTTKFSHPVNEPLAKSYDRAPATILDANGATTQATGDNIWTNNITLGSGNMVTCMSCHHPHHADSNSLTDWSSTR